MCFMLGHLAAGLLVLVGCSNRLPPKHPAVENTFPTTPTVRSLPEKLRVVTLNTHFETASNVIRGIRSDRELRDADLIIMQEVARDESNQSNAGDVKQSDDTPWCSAACALGRDLGYYAAYAPGHAQDPGSHGVAIVSRAPIMSTEVIELPYFNVRFNSGRRVALAVTVLVANKPVTVYAVHLDNRLTANDRCTQMTPVLTHAQQKKTPVIIAGDFNTGPATWLGGVIPIITTTQDNWFERTVRRHGFETSVANSGPTFRYFGMKLDGIYTRGFETLQFATANAANISDHLALWATLLPK